MKKVLIILCRMIQYIIAIIVMLFVLIALSTIAFPQFNGFCGYQIYTVVSESMAPELTIGDVILVKYVSPENIEIGDVIVYQGMIEQFKGKIITHKVTDKRYNEGKIVFTTKGTTNVLDDPEVNEDQVYGTVIYKMVVPSLIRKAMGNAFGFMLVIGVPLIVMTIFEFKELRRLIKSKNRKGGNGGRND